MRHVKFIAEATTNHGGDVKIAKEFIRAAASAGADYIKFQSFRSKNIASKEDWQYDWLHKTELSLEQHAELVEFSKKCGIKFLSTPFDTDSLRMLAAVGLDTIKIASFDLRNFALLAAAKENFRKMIVSTGMHSPDEIRETVCFVGNTNLTLLHCVSVYPLPPEKVNLRKMTWLKENFHCPVGFSDHSVGIEAAKIAIAMGAEVIEKHFCLGKNGPGRTLPFDITPKELEKLVDYAEKSEVYLGDGSLSISPEEENWRKKLVGRFKC